MRWFQPKERLRLRLRLKIGVRGIIFNLDLLTVHESLTRLRALPSPKRLRAGRRNSSLRRAGTKHVILQVRRERCRFTNIDAGSVNDFSKGSRMWEREGNCLPALIAGRRSPKEFFQVSVLQRVLKVPGPLPVDQALRSSPEGNGSPVVHRWSPHGRPCLHAEVRYGTQA